MRDLVLLKKVHLPNIGAVTAEMYWVQQEDGRDPGHWECYDKRIPKVLYPIASPEYESAFNDHPSRRELSTNPIPAMRKSR